jgi:hypothetical protein
MTLMKQIFRSFLIGIYNTIFYSDSFIILNSFPLLTSMHLKPSSNPLSDGPHLLHSIAATFAGNPTLKSIRCASVSILDGALSCPRLTGVRLDFSHEWTEDGFHFATNTWRNVPTILHHFKNLKYLYCEAPEFTDIKFNSANQLKRLRLGSFTETTMEDLIAWLNMGAVLPNLQQLAIDGDYLHFPEKAVQAISMACPIITNLKMK